MCKSSNKDTGNYQVPVFQKVFIPFETFVRGEPAMKKIGQVAEK